jgi:hypothetical protein
MRTDVRVMLLAVLAAVLALAYAITPYSAFGLRGAPTQIASNTRYGIPALLVAAPVVAWLGGQLGKAKVALEAALLVAVLLGLRNHLYSPTSHVVVTGLASAAIVGAVWSALRSAHVLRSRVSTAGTRQLALAGTVVVTALCGVAALGYHYQRNLAARPYIPSDPAVSYVLAHAPAHSRIGLAGEWTARGLVPVAPLFGPRLNNELEYVGPFVKHMRSEYTTSSAFLAALRRGRYRMLVVGTGFPPVAHPSLELWARLAGFVPVARSLRLIALRAPGL